MHTYAAHMGPYIHYNILRVYACIQPRNGSARRMRKLKQSWLNPFHANLLSIHLRIQQRYLQPRQGSDGQGSKLEVRAQGHYAVSWLFCHPLDRACHCHQPHQHPPGCDPEVDGNANQNHKRVMGKSGCFTEKPLTTQTAHYNISQYFCFDTHM